MTRLTRIVGGVAGGQRLVVPSGQSTRPTSGRAREALFSSLEALRGPLFGARVLDLYAGSGALGLEALSRGAARVVLVESERRALDALRENVRAVGLPDVEVVGVRVGTYLAAPPHAGPFDVVLADPPYALAGDTLDAELATLSADGWLAPGAVVVVERSSRDVGPRWPPGVDGLRARRYGEACLWYGRAAAALPTAAADAEEA